MKNKGKPTRLSKAAREFNISTATITGFLKKKGYEISSNPNAKVSPEMYDLLLQEYSQEKSVKEEAKKHSLKYTQKRSISLEDKEEEEKQKEQEEEEPDEFEDTVFIKNTSLSASTPEAGQKEEKPAKEEAGGKEEEKADEVKPSREQEAQKTTAAEEEKTQKKSPEEEKTKEKPAEKSEEKAPEAEAVPEEEKQDNEVKILGKIDLESIEPKKSKSKKATTTKKESARKKETKEQPAAEKPQQQKEKETSQKQAGEKQPQKQPAKAKQPEKEPAKSEPEKQARKKATPKKETPPKAKGEQKPKPASKAGKKEETVEQKAEPKTQPSAPKKEKASEKTQKSAEKEQPQKPAAKPQAESEQKQKAPEKEAPKEKAKEEDNFIKTQVEKLDGPKILGTIDLSDHTKKTEKKRPEKKKDDRKRKQERKKPADKKQPAKEGEKTDEKRKPVASSKDESIRPKKKRRKRIKPEPAQQQEGKGKRGPQEGKADKRQQRGKPTKKTVSKVKKPQRHEPSEEEVQKQLKETMARLSEGGKKKSVKHRRTKRDAIKKKEQEQADEEKNIIKVTEFVTVNELANMMDANVNQVISTCMSLGLFVSINQRLDAETINLVADEFGYDVEFVSVEVQEALEEQEAEEETPDEGNLESRAPIITVMGHVDHGKTSLLDHIRQANVIGAESGGITQHIGAYEVETQSGKKITFLDTPGHEAFTAMRARGAQITDIAIIIIAADDQIMPQTIEAINHAQAAGVTIVFAINKIDKPGANPDKIREQLSHRDILVEEWGGKYQSQEISAKKGDGIEELLERVLLEAELLELKGNPNKKAKGTVIESALDKGRGYVANLLVQDGTLKKGDYVLAGAHSGKVRAMYNERNQQVQQVGPSTPVLMLGLDGAPQAGDQFNVFEDEREAKELANKRRQLQREQGIRTQKHVTLDEIGRRIAIGDFKELNVIVKGDVDGSVEALADALLKLGNQEVQVNVIHKSVGQISESDVMLASASEAIIVGFQVRPSSAARKLAEKEQIDIRTYSVIYKAIEEVKAAIEGMLAPKIEEKVVCNLEVRDTFKIKKVGTVAGCKVLDGIINRNTKVRIIRDGIVIHTGELGSLKRYKDDVKEVKAGYECGLNLKNFNDIKPGDIIEGFKEVEVERKLGE